MLAYTEAMYREERLEKMWRILDMVRPEGYVLLDEHSFYWIAPKEEAERDYYTERSTYFSVIGVRDLVERVAQANLIVPVPDPEGRSRYCFELSNLGRRALDEYNGDCWETRASIVDALALAHSQNHEVN